MEITVWSGGAAEPGLDFVAAAFQKETGHAVRITYNLGARGRKRMEDGEVFDVLVATRDAMDSYFRPTGQVEEGGIGIGRVGLGAMVRPGAPVPDISSTEAFKRAVLEADALIYTEEASGLRIDGILGKLGIAEQVKAKVTHARNGPELMDRVLRGSGREIGFLPITAILTYREKGIVLAGPLPEELQYYLELMAVPSTKSPHKDVAWKFVRYCGEQGKPLLAANGLN